MVKYFFTYFLFIFLSFSANAQMPFDATFGNFGGSNAVKQQEETSFQASIDKKSVAAGQVFQIKLELVNADAYSPPDTSVFPDDLSVQSQTQQSNVSIINGVSTKTTAWIYEVIAEEPGAYQIPAISIQTDLGTLYSQDFNIYAKDAGQLPANTGDGAIFIESKVEKTDPYRNEPVKYAVRVYHLKAIDQAELIKPKSDDLLIEQIQEPKKSQEFLNGQQYNVLEVVYLVTPLESGEIKIPPAVLRGKVLKEVRKKRPRTAFDDFFDPFAIIDTTLSLTRELEPFTVASNKIALNVKPPVAGVEPWLALYDLKIEDELLDLKKDPSKGLKAKVGEPISRKVSLTAIGATASSLPDIERLTNADGFKIYADKPELTQKMITAEEGPLASKIKGVRSQSFTFIPEREGELTIPEVKLAYYSIPDQKVKYAILSGKVLDVEPADNNTNNIGSIDKNSSVDNKVSNESEDNLSILGDISLVNILLLLILIVLIIYFMKKISSVKNQSLDGNEAVKGVKNKKGGSVSHKIEDDSEIKKGKSANIIVEIKNAQDFKMLEKAVKNYAVQEFGASGNSSVTVIAQQLARKYKLSRSEVVRSFSELDAAIYTGKNVKVEQLKVNLLNIFKKIEEKKGLAADKKNKTLTSLNPS